MERESPMQFNVHVISLAMAISIMYIVIYNVATCIMYS